MWDSFFAGLGIPGQTNAQAGTFMHELGHNLGLGHGGLVLDTEGNVIGADHTNYKPNHLSVMNYSFQTRGLRKKGFLGLFWNGHFDYSRFGSNVLPELEETDLSEADGLNGGDAVKDYGTRYYCQATDETEVIDGLQQAVDWNCDGDDTDSGVMTNINKDTTSGGGPRLTTLVTVNEWQHLRYKGGAIGALGVSIELPEVTSMEESPELTLEEDLKIGPYSYADTDDDGIPDIVDNCTVMPNLDQLDDDGDGYGNVCDNCLSTPNPGQEDENGNGIGDACEGPDSDDDGVPDSQDNCPGVPNPNQEDTDGDTVGDACDNCPNDVNQDQADRDNDSVGDVCDNCPDDPNKIDPGICGCGIPDSDSDNDGTPDCNDNCPSDPNKTEPGICGCGVPDTDSDNDGIPDCNDGCPTDPNKTQPGQCGCGTPDTDSDADGTADCNDNCPQDPDKIAPGICGCGTPDTDSDGDGIPDCNDNCPSSYNPGQEDSDGDGTGDACEGHGTQTVCSTLGESKSPIPDRDIFEFTGNQGEEVTIRLEANPNGSSQGQLATLMVRVLKHPLLHWTDNVHTDSGTPLPKGVTLSLPRTGKYELWVKEQQKWQKNRFGGDYCLTLKSSGDAWQTLQPTHWVE
jgi:hypothetical protein